MEVSKTAISLSVLLWLVWASALDAEEPEVTTEGFQFPTYETTATVTESPDDNGMVIGDIPPEIGPPIAPSSKEEQDLSPLEHPPVPVSFPDNHKNFTPSQFLGEGDFPPYYDHLSAVQQQYKNYNEQKQMYSRKPIKFEETVVNNHYLPRSPNDGGENKKIGNTRTNRNPFPYAFEKEQTRQIWQNGHAHTKEKTTPEGWYNQQNVLQDHDQSYRVKENAPEEWYKQQTHVPDYQHPYKLNENAPEEWYKRDEHVLRGQGPPLPYYYVGHSYPQEDEFFRNELLHFDHHHPKKDEKEGAWKKVFHVLTALVPLGLLLASLSPNVISINSTSTAKTTRQRSEDARRTPFREEDVLKLMRKYGVESLREAQCEDRILCELAVAGSNSAAGPIEKGFWFLANQTPWDIAEKADLSDLFKAIKAGKCDGYRCHAKVKSSNSGSTGKKPIWKRKMGK